MDSTQWIALLSQSFRGMEKKLEQVLQLNSCREHWIQAEISLHAWFENEIEIWTDMPIGNGRKADLFAQDDNGSPIMVAEVKCLGDDSQTKCLEGDWSVRTDIERLRSIDCPARLFVLVIVKGEKETNMGARLRNDEWVNDRKSVDVDMGFALVRIWAL